MNDRYLFRGKREKDEQWEYGAFWQSNSSIIDKLGYSQKVIPETVGQCTGLKDKNGKLIFEGDICEYGSSVGVIRYYNDDAMYSFVYDENDAINFDCMHGNDLEIVGNVTDNPELLEVKE